MTMDLEIQLIAIITSVSCSLPGAFLVLRKMSMMSDAITHTILLGIVLAYFITNDFSSPFLIISASLMGLVTVWLTELLQTTKLVSEDTAIGVIFPFLFSISVILITRYTGSIHLDTDSVLTGELAFAPFNRMIFAGKDIGAKAIYSSLAILCINIIVITSLFKELKLNTFDPMLASLLGFSPILLHYIIMSLVSVTSVSAFESVGAILVVAFMIGPPVTAFLITKDLKKMLVLSSVIGAVSAVLGYQSAKIFDVSIAGSITVAIGIIFSIIFVFAPKSGMLTKTISKNKQKKEIAKNTLLLYIYKNHIPVLKFDILQKSLNWSNKKINYVILELEKEKIITTNNDTYTLTDKGLNLCAHITKKLFN